MTTTASTVWKIRFSSRQGAKNAKVGIGFFSLRPLRLCGKYSEIWLRLCRAK